MPLLIPLTRGRINSRNFVPFAIAIGLGFGIGELWFLAYRTTFIPEFAALPFYQFGGFITERFFVCLLHGGTVSLALWRLTRGGFGWGVLGAMIGHFLLNFPIFLASFDLGGLGKTNWQVILSLWVELFWIATIFLLSALQLRKNPFPAAFAGTAKCPECGTIYKRPFIGANLGVVRYEKCPNCRKYHWV
ncbi:MAG: hypothetical protein HY023_11920 [Chloroflexi bacterium]|nr:hypothetical protein [Chloroflexota bacterium]